MNEEIDNHYYKIHHKTNTSSSWHIKHTLDEVRDYLAGYETESSYGREFTITRVYGWDEEERKELARLKAKYEPES